MVLNEGDQKECGDDEEGVTADHVQNKALTNWALRSHDLTGDDRPYRKVIDDTVKVYLLLMDYRERER